MLLHVTVLLVGRIRYIVLREKFQMSNFKGFTLIELLVVMTIMFAGSVTGIVLFGWFVEAKALDTTASEVESLLNNARINAVTQTLPPSSDIACTDGQGYSRMQKYSVRITSTTTYEMDVYCGGAPVPIDSKKFKLPDKVTFSVASDEVSFLAGRGISPAAKTITLNGTSGTKTITIDTAGNITKL